MPIRQERIGQFQFETLSFLSQHESRSRDEILEHLDRVLEPSAEETQLGKSGRPDWVIRFLWYTVGMVKAGWITKDGRGVWAATDDGRLALDKFPNAPSLAATDAAYRSWHESQQVPQRRAWLVRGSSVLGVNVVPEWLERDFCSVAGSQLRAIEPGIEPGIEPDELRRIATEDYETWRLAPTNGMTTPTRRYARGRTDRTYVSRSFPLARTSSDDAGSPRPLHLQGLRS